MTEETKKAPILMSNLNPDGWKLEELMVKLRHEMHIKIGKIEKDPREVAKRVTANNRQIVELMREIQRLQEDNIEAMRQIGPDQGPRETPRIGEGSPDYTG